MTQEQILFMVDYYHQFEERIKDTLAKLQKIDYYTYSTFHGIVRWYIENDLVWIIYDDSIYGQYSEDSTCFPTHWLALNDDFLENVAIEDKIEREKKNAEAVQAATKAAHELGEKMEREQYEKLKAKFENETI